MKLGFREEEEAEGVVRRDLVMLTVASIFWNWSGLGLEACKECFVFLSLSYSVIRLLMVRGQISENASSPSVLVNAAEFFDLDLDRRI